MGVYEDYWIFWLGSRTDLSQTIYKNQEALSSCLTLAWDISAVNIYGIKALGLIPSAVMETQFWMF